MTDDALALPLDPTAEETLARQGLRLGLVDSRDDAVYLPWLQAVARGFLDPTLSDATIAEGRPDHLLHRDTGVWDDTAAEPASPVATIAGWRNALTVPGGASVEAWAISAVTVAPTHRRRGIARALLEAELRTAAAAGLPIAMLTVSEATIYGRFGFGAAARAADLAILPRRAGWRGAPVPGRVHLVGRARMLEDAPAIYERARLRAPGGIALSGMLFTRLFGRESDDADLRRRRFLRYDDEAGTPQGFAVYTATESETDFVESSLDLGHLSAATDHASAALWRTLLEHDLIGHLTARLRPEDDAVHWLVGDQRAIRTRVSDHLWLRVLDPQVALAARSYAGPARLALRVADPAGFAAGRFLLEVDDAGRAEVSQLGDDEDPGFAAVSLDAETLGSLYLGGVPARTLAAAGRLTEERPRSVDALDRAFRSPAAPFLGVWF